MKLRLTLQAAVYCTVVLSTPLLSVAEVGYTDAEQRLSNLEVRVDNLELASSSVNLAGYSSCDTKCGDSCCGDSCCGNGCESSCGCKSRCGGSCCWLRPCPFAQFDAELLLFSVQDSEAEFVDGQDQYNAGLRLTYSKVNGQGKIFRVRYFNFGSTLEGGSNRYEMEEIDTEIGRRFTLGGGLKGEFTAGVRYAAFDERGSVVDPSGHNYDTTFGPLVGVQLRGRKVMRGTSFASLRQSWQFGESDDDTPDTAGTFKITEVQLGLEWKRPVRMGTLVLRSAIEAQYWSGVQEGDTEDIGLIGSSSSFGLAY